MLGLVSPYVNIFAKVGITGKNKQLHRSTKRPAQKELENWQKSRTLVLSSAHHGLCRISQTITDKRNTLIAHLFQTFDTYYQATKSNLATPHPDFHIFPVCRYWP